MKTFVPEKVLNGIAHSALAAFGKEHILPSECKLLSETIFCKTQKTVSETTLKRLFGFAKRDFDFSIYTLEALAEYSGYVNWNAFCLHHSPEIVAEEKDDPWQKLKTTSRIFSLQTMKAIRHSSGSVLNTIEREEFTYLINTFINSNKSIAPIIAPAGFGKSVGLFHTAYKLWLGENPVYQDDICCFINAHQLINIAFNHHSFAEWIMQYHQLDEKLNAFDLARHHKLIFIIDGIDGRSLSPDKQRIVFANISEFANIIAGYGNVKIILGMRPFSWKKFKSAFGNTAFFEDKIFIDRSYPLEEHVNHTLFFSRPEIVTLLNKNGVDHHAIDNCSEKFMTFLCYPGYMRLFCNSKYIHSLKYVMEETIIYEVTNIFIKHHFNFDKTLLKNIAENVITTRTGSAPGSSGEHDITAPPGITCYQELFDNYILQEEYRSQDIFSFPDIKFVNHTIEEYCIAYYCLTQNNLIIGKNLVDFIFNLPISREMKKGVIKWIIIDMVNKNKVGELECIFNNPAVTQPEMISFFEFLFSIKTDKQINESVIKSFSEKYELTDIFLAQKEFDFYFLQKEYFIVKLLGLAKTGLQKKALLLILFTRCLSELRITDAETYLKYYRVEEKNEKNLFTDVQEKVMSLALDFFRYDNINITGEILAKKLTEILEITDVTSPAFIYCPFLLLIHHAVLAGESWLIENITVGALNLVREDEADITFITMLKLINSYS